MNTLCLVLFLGAMEIDFPETFDWDSDPLDLFSFNVLVFDNNNPDIQVLSVKHDTELAMFIQREFGEDAIQTIVNNLDVNTKDRCPYFRIVMSEFGQDTPINFKLRCFYNQIGMSTLNPRCKRAMAIGLHALRDLDSPITMPLAFCTTNVEIMDYRMEDGIDLSCLKPCAQKLYSSTSTLCDIAGLVLPYHLPCELQWRILSYLQRPDATLIKTAIDNVRYDWDDSVMPMFRQREPRIPAHIAHFYNASTVQCAIDAAIKCRHAVCVCRKDLPVRHQWQSLSGGERM